MNIFCTLTGHLASDQLVRNGPNLFSRCARCEIDLVENGGKWISAPRGYRIVWRSVREKPALPAPEVGIDSPTISEDQRHRPDRRIKPKGAPPGFLGGRERRRIRDRRSGFGKRPPPPIVVG